MTHSIPDIINGTYESLGGIFVLLNVYETYKKKKVVGINWGSTIFFTTWSMYNMWYYPQLKQNLSFCGGCFLALGNIIWVCLRWKYRKN